MSTRPGAPQSTTDEYLAAILEELRALRARLDQGAADSPFTIDADVTEAIQEAVDEAMHPGRGVVV
jgi:hypothetical protein